MRNLPRVVPLFASDQEPPSATRPSADDGFGREKDGESGHWIDASPDPEATLAEIEERLQRLRSPFRTAEAFWVEEIIDPRRTRRLLCEFAEMAEKLLELGMARFPPRP